MNEPGVTLEGQYHIKITESPTGIYTIKIINQNSSKDLVIGRGHDRDKEKAAGQALLGAYAWLRKRWTS